MQNFPPLYELFDYNTPILDVLADFIYARIFIAGVSSLSKVSTFLGHKKLIIINDDNKHSVNTECVKISDYINENKKKIYAINSSDILYFSYNNLLTYSPLVVLVLS